MRKMIRIGNAGGYWGDDLSALKRQLTGGKLDYITIDFLAEITKTILQRQQHRNPELGFAGDFLGQLEECLPLIVEKNVRVITNAGGINPIGLGKKIRALAKKMGYDMKVGVVYGDDIVDSLPELEKAGEKFTNMETGQNFDVARDKVTTANIYFGADPVVKALDQGCQIIVTGRVTDTGITLAPMIHEFGWAFDDWDRISAGIIAGHIIECGTQGAGGNITDWEDVPSFHNMGYPIIEMSKDGTFVVTKHKKTGGLVNEKSVKEQLLYEMGDPNRYLAPDGIARFDTIQLADLGNDRVRISGIKGEPRPETLKISMAYNDGFKASGSILVCGPDVEKKADAISDAFWHRLNTKFDATHTSLVGTGSIWPKSTGRTKPNEALLRFGVRDQDKKKVHEFGMLLPALILSGPSGMAVTGGRPKPSQVVAYWPALIDRNRVLPKVTILPTSGRQKNFTIKPPVVNLENKAPKPAPLTRKIKITGKTKKVSLRTLAYARSGDKGDTCNVGVLARTPEIHQWLIGYLTAAKVKRFFDGIVLGKVTRHEMPNLHALNFLLEETLGGGGTVSLMLDPQGKTLSQALLEMEVSVPTKLIRGL
jgi:ubiquitin